jgi:hypothetical protein
MGRITIEFTDRIEGDPCLCCGGRTTALTRFVYRDGDAHAVYYASFSDRHPDRWVSVAISLGNWTEGSMPGDRVAFALRIRATSDEYQTGVVNAALSPWNDVDILGQMLDRQGALKHLWIKEVFHLCDHIVMEDKDVRSYLDGMKPRRKRKRS